MLYTFIKPLTIEIALHKVINKDLYPFLPYLQLKTERSFNKCNKLMTVILMGTRVASSLPIISDIQAQIV